MLNISGIKLQRGLFRSMEAHGKTGGFSSMNFVKYEGTWILSQNKGYSWCEMWQKLLEVVLSRCLCEINVKYKEGLRFGVEMLFGKIPSLSSKKMGFKNLLLQRKKNACLETPYLKKNRHGPQQHKIEQKMSRADS